MRPRTRSILIGVAALVVVGAVARISSRNDLCGSCGTTKIATSVIGIPWKSEFEETDDSRWMLAHAGDRHDHNWVYSHTTWGGLTSAGIACALPEEWHHLLALWNARDRVGDDPELIALVNEFTSLGASDAQRRSEISRLASALGAGHVPAKAAPLAKDE